MIELYCITREIGEERYAGEIPAGSWEEAEALAEKIGAVVDGRLIAEIPASDEELEYYFRPGGVWRSAKTRRD